MDIQTYISSASVKFTVSNGVENYSDKLHIQVNNLKELHNLQHMIEYYINKYDANNYNYYSYRIVNYYNYNNVNGDEKFFVKFYNIKYYQTLKDLLNNKNFDFHQEKAANEATIFLKDGKSAAIAVGIVESYNKMNPDNKYDKISIVFNK